MDRDNKAQSLTEYVLIIAVAMAAVIGMQTVFKRSLQARYKDVVDYTIDQVRNAPGGSFSGMRNQYEPYYLSSETVSNMSTHHSEEVDGRLERYTYANVYRASTQTLLSANYAD